MSLTTLLVMALAQQTLAQSYGLFRSHSGASFFDGMEFVSGYDNTTTGDVNYTSGIGSLATIQPDGTARLAVDTGVVPVGGLRGSVKIRTTEAYGLGNVFVLDAAHVPVGCSVWPAWYTVADQSRWKWPVGGEFDVLETQNLGAFNQMSSHVAAPDNNTQCTVAPGLASGTDQLGTDCNAWANYNSGCAYSDSRATSTGAALNTNGGGVWAFAFLPTGGSMWFWPRGSVPADVAAGSTSVTPSAWPQAQAVFPFGPSCSSSLYGDQQLIITTTLCGQWAGIPQVFESTCTLPRGARNCSSLVWGDGAKYAEAYWSINSLRVFSATAAGNATNSSPTSSSSSAMPSSTSSVANAVTTQVLPAATGVVATKHTGSAVNSFAPALAPIGLLLATVLAYITI